MPRTASTPAMRRLRIALLIAIVVVVAGVAGLFFLGRAARPSAETQPVAAAPDPGLSPEDDKAVLSEGFDYEQQVAGKPVFRLQGDRFTTDRDGKVALEGVTLVLYREGEPYEVRSRSAVYDPETQDAELEGDVHVTGGDGWELSGARLELEGKTQTILSRRSDVSFRRGEQLAGSARRLRYRMEEQVLVLEGAVRVEGSSEDQRSSRLAAEKMTWHRDGSTVVAVGSVQLESAADRIEAERLDARMRPGTAVVESATAVGEVRGTLSTPDDGRLAFEAERATVDFDANSAAPAAVLLGGEHRREAAEVVWSAPGEPSRRLTAPVVQVALTDGRPAEARAARGVELVESGVEGGERRAAANQIRVSFSPDGALADATLMRNVSVVDGGWTVEGEDASLEAGGARGEVRGRPARASGERGELLAPTLRFDRDLGRLDAAIGVRVTFRPDAAPLAAGNAADTSLPVDAESREATFLERPRRFEMRGNVRAARGESLLFADRLEGDESTDVTIATGSVRTQWTASTAEGGEATPSVTVITAQRLEYRRGGGEAFYSGGVVARRVGREIRGDELRVEFDEDGQARRLLASGSVTIDDRVSGRSVGGESADYDLTAGQAIVVGSPVVLRETSGTVLRGRRALFDERTGSSRLLSDAP